LLELYQAVDSIGTTFVLTWGVLWVFEKPKTKLIFHFWQKPFIPKFGPASLEATRGINFGIGVRNFDARWRALRACLLGVAKCFITYKTFAKYYSDTSQFPGGMSIHEWANSGAKLRKKGVNKSGYD
jgi:hypothetical protein